MTVSKLYDVLVVGGGPAGLGSTLAAARLHRSVANFDSGVYRNQASDAMHTVVGVDGMKPIDWLAGGRAQLQKDGVYGQWVDIIPRQVQDIVPVQSPVTGQTRFELLDAAGEKWLGRKVVLANGVTDEMPPISGFKELWGKSIAHCVFCHGQELCQGDDPHLAVLLTADTAMNGMIQHSINHFAKLIPGDRMILLVNGHFEPDTDGNMPLSSGMTSETLALFKARKTRFIFPAITSFETTVSGHTVHFKSGPPLHVSGTLHHPVVRPNNMFGLAKPPKGIFDAPTELVAGVSVAGNAKTQFSGVSAAEADGVLAIAAGVGKELAQEDADADLASAGQCSVLVFSNDA